MPYYSADSVVAELKSNNTLVCEGISELGCPSPAPSSSTHEGKCPGNPSLCKDCTNQKCNQWVIIRSDKYMKLGVLIFSFIFSTHPRGGRIRKDDSQLARFVRKNLIDINKLDPC